MSGPKFDLEEQERARTVGIAAIYSPAKVAVRFVELERQRTRLAAALKQLLDYTLACELVAYDVGEQHDEHPAVASARAALRESGGEP